MRVLLYARAQEAIPLAVCLRAGLLIGGIEQADADAMIERFKADPDGVLVSTNAWVGKWRSDVEAAVFFLETSFVMSKWEAVKCVKEPSFNPPTQEDFFDWYFNRVPEPLNALPEPCPTPRREGDEYTCPRCHIRWDTHEDQPPCPQA